MRLRDTDKGVKQRQYSDILTKQGELQDNTRLVLPLCFVVRSHVFVSRAELQESPSSSITLWSGHFVDRFLRKRHIFIHFSDFRCVVQIESVFPFSESKIGINGSCVDLKTRFYFFYFFKLLRFLLLSYPTWLVVSFWVFKFSWNYLHWWINKFIDPHDFVVFSLIRQLTETSELSHLWIGNFCFYSVLRN